MLPKQKKKPRKHRVFKALMAEAVGFEPTCPCGQLHFECSSLQPLRYASVYKYSLLGTNHMISSQSRYDHFDIAPCLFPPAILVVSKALKNPLERKAGEKAKKYSIWIFGNPELARVFEGMKFPASAEISSAARYIHFDTLPCINIHLWGLITWFRAI